MSLQTSIDVVICTYNNARLLDLALDALSRQHVAPGIDWGILIVNNNCTDDTADVFKKHAAVCAVPLTMVAEEQQGLTPARLCGVKSTVRDWIAFVDDDCLVADNWVDAAAVFARSHDDCSAFGGRVVLDWEKAPPDYLASYGWAYAEQEHGPEPKRLQCLAGAGFVVRRAALDACGWTKAPLLADRIGHKLISGGDVEMALRVGSISALWYNPECILRHRIAAHRMSPRYLRWVVYGLGASKFLGDSMVWARSYPGWLLASMLAFPRLVREPAKAAVKLARGDGNLVDAIATSSFLLGWFSGVLRLLTMPSHQRSALVGRAVRQASQDGQRS